ncbi:hypothetical protein ACLKA6_013583 [Drosophila palustris]
MPTDIDVVLELIGFGWTQLLMFLGSALTIIYIVNEIMGISIVAISIACEFNLTHTELFLLTSAGFLGMILSSHYAGYKSDQIGRPMPLFYCFLFFRFLAGLLLSLWHQCERDYLLVISSILVPLLAHLFDPLHSVLWSMGSFHVRVWRLCMLLNLIPGILSLIAFWALPESAKFMLSKGNAEGAYKTLNRLCRYNRRQSLESLGVTSVTQPNAQVPVEKQSNFFHRLWFETLPLLRPPYGKPLLIITCIICGYFFVGNGFALWFVKIRYLLSDNERIMCDHLKDVDTTPSESTCTNKPINYTEGIFLGISALGSCVWISILLLCLSRRRIMFINSVISAIGGLSLNLVRHQIVQLVAMVVFISMCTSTITLASSVIADMVPTYLRGKAISLAFMFARIAVIIANSLIGHFLYDYCLITFNLFVLVVIVVAILTLFLHL